MGSTGEVDSSGVVGSAGEGGSAGAVEGDDGKVNLLCWMGLAVPSRKSGAEVIGSGLECVGKELGLEEVEAKVEKGNMYPKNCTSLE